MDTPRLSKTIAIAIKQKSCAHAYAEHRLLGKHKADPTKAMDDGNIFEALIIGGSDSIAVIDAKDFKGKDARAERDAARAAGKYPIVKAKYDWACKVADTVRESIDRELAAAGVVWDLDRFATKQRYEWISPEGVECSGEIDAECFDNFAYAILDFKKCESAHPESVRRAAIRHGWDISQAAYTEAFETDHSRLAGRGDFLFVCYEIEPPYAVQLYRLDGKTKAFGEMRWNDAKRQWKQCLETGVWPGYGEGPLDISVRDWEMAEEFEKQEAPVPDWALEDDNADAA